MGVLDVAEKKDHFVDAASMRYLVGSEPCQPHLGNELIDEDDYTNGADEASQEGTAENIVQEAESEDTSDKNECSSQTCHDASNLGV
jgi:hypothetical protein